MPRDPNGATSGVPPSVYGPRPTPTPAGGAPPPQSLPTNLNDFYRMRFGQPENIREIMGHQTGPEALFYQAYLADQEYRARGEKQLKDTRGVLYRGREQSRNLMRGAGEVSIRDAERDSRERQAGIEEDAISRGLYGTTVLDAGRRREAESLNRTRGDIRAAVARDMSGMEERYSNQIAGVVGGVNYAAPSYDLIRQALITKMTPTGGSNVFQNVASGALTGAAAGAGAGPYGALAGAAVGGIAGGIAYR